MKFLKTGTDRWASGPFVIAKYANGFFAYRCFRYKNGCRDAKRLHHEDKPASSFADAKTLCERVLLEPVPAGIRLISAR